MHLFKNIEKQMQKFKEFNGYVTHETAALKQNDTDIED